MSALTQPRLAAQRLALLATITALGACATPDRTHRIETARGYQALLPGLETQRIGPCPGEPRQIRQPSYGKAWTRQRHAFRYNPLDEDFVGVADVTLSGDTDTLRAYRPDPAQGPRPGPTTPRRIMPFTPPVFDLCG